MFLGGGRRYGGVCRGGDEWEEMFYAKHWKKDGGGNGLSSLNWESL